LLFWHRRGKRFSPLLPHPLIVLPAGRLLGLSGFWFCVGFPSLTQSFFARWQALRPFRFLVSTGFPLSHPILPIGRPQVFPAYNILSRTEKYTKFKNPTKRWAWLDFGFACAQKMTCTHNLALGGILEKNTNVKKFNW
jgi:hypothetical protein